MAKNNILLYVNADIILTSDLIPATEKVKSENFDNFLMVGRRWDVDINEEIDFNGSDWKNKLMEKVKTTGKLHGLSGIDYFIFPKCLLFNLPKFTVGRPGWDNWLIYNVKSLKIPVIDITNAVWVIHQNSESDKANKTKEN